MTTDKMHLFDENIKDRFYDMKDTSNSEFFLNMHKKRLGNTKFYTIDHTVVKIKSYKSSIFITRIGIMKLSYFL